MSKYRGHKKRRILFNWDGSDVLSFLGDNPTPERYLDWVFHCLDGSQVDTLLYNFGSGNVAEYASDVLEWPGEADGFRFSDDNSRWRYENAKKLADQGANPPEIISRACRERGLEVFFSMRMNDIHDGWMTSERPSFKRKHPEWLLPQLRDGHTFRQDGVCQATSLNYAVKEVRDLKLEVIREVFSKWDYDGIELDWSRHHNHFLPGTEFENRHHLTEFTREVRQIAEKGAARLGHPVHVFARVPETIQGCQKGGYDVIQWFKEEIVDGLILGDMVVCLPFLHQFREFMGKKKIPLYPSVYGYGMGYGLWDDAVIRGIAANLWAAGADGLATYNLYPRGEFRRNVLKQIGHPDSLSGQNKSYFCPRNQLQVFTRFSRHNCPASPLPVFLNVSFIANYSDYIPHTVWADIEVADDVKAAAEQGKFDKVELLVGIRDLLEDDRVLISLNGHSLTEDWGDVVFPHIETVTWDINSRERERVVPEVGDPNDIHLEFPAVRFQVPPDLIRKGTNTVQVLLLPTEKRPRDKKNNYPPVFISRIEIFTVFK